jgi:hypothetical protein
VSWSLSIICGLVALSMVASIVFPKKQQGAVVQ